MNSHSATALLLCFVVGICAEMEPTGWRARGNTDDLVDPSGWNYDRSTKSAKNYRTTDKLIDPDGWNYDRRTKDVKRTTLEDVAAISCYNFLDICQEEVKEHCKIPHKCEEPPTCNTEMRFMKRFINLLLKSAHLSSYSVAQGGPTSGLVDIRVTTEDLRLLEWFGDPTRTVSWQQLDTVMTRVINSGLHMSKEYFTLMDNIFYFLSLREVWLWAGAFSMTMFVLWLLLNGHPFSGTCILMSVIIFMFSYVMEFYHMYKVTMLSASNCMDVIDTIDILSDEEESDHHCRNNIRRPRCIGECVAHFEIWTDEEFFCRFRLTKQSVVELLRLIENDLKTFSDQNCAVAPMNRLLLALRFYATGTMLIAAGDFSGVSKSSACRIVKQVSKAIGRLQPQLIKMPQTEEEIQRTHMKFHSIARFPRVIAALDCTHAKIQSPGGANAEYYRNRKGFFSMNIQTACDADLRILDIVARWPGSTHDQVIFNNSQLKARLERRIWKDSLVLADSGYENRQYLVTPFLNPTTRAENLYNESHIRTRNVVERMYGVWKRRFPVLSMGMRLSLDTVQSVIVATACLHNLACNRKEAQPPVDLNVNVPQEDGLAENFPPPVEGFQGTDQTRQILVRDYYTWLLNNENQRSE